jgi:DNA-binding CsgD family transcriptional regulator
VNVCPACNRPLPDEARYLTERELAALSAWWWFKSTRAAATALGLSEQTVKNQLQTARHRNGVERTVDLAFMFMQQISPAKVVRTSHNSRTRSAA